MTTPLRSIRLKPTETDFLDQYRLNSGDIFYDQNRKTLVVFDGILKGGIPLLRADLSNIAGGGGAGAGLVNFGAKTIQAQAFIGDGSGLTNLPIPADIANKPYVDDKFITPATTSTLGTIKVGLGLSITPDGVLTADGVADITDLANLDSIGFKAGVTITEFSSDPSFSGNSDAVVPTEKAIKTYVDTAISNVPLDENGIIQTGTATHFPYYAADGKTLSDVGTNLTWNSSLNKLTALNIAVGNDLTVTRDATVTRDLNVTRDLSVTRNAGVTGNLTVTGTADVTSDASVGGNLSVDGYIRATEIFNDGAGSVKYTSGADFIIDAPGQVNVSGSRIVNIGYPVDPTDAVSKSYVDGAASQFTGGTVPNAINITATTASTSTTTGALIVGGGAGFAGAIYAGGTIYSNGSPVLTSLSGGYNGGTITGTLYINNTTQSSSTGTGALRISGGVGIGRTLYVGGEIRVNTIHIGNGTGTSGSGFTTNTVIGGGNPLAANVSGTNVVAVGYNTLGQVTDGTDNIAIGAQAQFNRTTGSQNISIGTDSLLQNLGFGNLAIGHTAGSLLSTGDNNVIIGGNTGLDIDTLSSHIIIADGAGTVKIQFNNNGALGVPTLSGINYGSANDVLASDGSGAPLKWISLASLGFTGGAVANATQFNSTTASTSTSTGAVTIAGGLGVAGAIHAGSINGPVVATTLSANDAVTFTKNTVSTSTSTGTLVVSGGVGIAGAVNTGSTLNIAGITSITSGEASTTFQNGALVVSGGVGIAGAINANSTLGVGGILTANSGTVSNGTTSGALVVNGGVGISGSLNVGSTAGLGGITSFTANVASTTTGTGSIVVTGGAGISGALNVGTTLGVAGVVTLSNGTASTASNNGALVISSGGLGVGGQINVGGATSKFTAITASSSTSTGTVTIGGGLGVGGAIYAASLQNTPIGSVTTNTGAFTSVTASSLTVSGLTTIQQTTEVLNTLTGATGVVIHNLLNGIVWYHTTAAANFTANFTNVPTTNNRVITVVLIIVQGATARIPNAVQIDGAAQTINWLNNAAPTGTANRTEAFSFNLIRTGSAWRVLGGAQAY